MHYRKTINALVVSILTGLLLYAPCIQADERFSDFLPIGKKWVIEKGYGDDLPLPIGIRMYTFTQEQDLELDEVKIDYPAVIQDLLNIAGIEEIDITPVDLTSEIISYNISIDAWVLPFLNVYIFTGHVEGESVLTAKTDWTDIIPKFEFKMDYAGTSIGYGMTLVGGYKRFFASIDANYSITELDISDSTIKTTNIAPRIGVRDSFGPINGQVWIGAFHQDVTENIVGDARFPIPAIGFNSIISYDITQKAKEPWNYVFGGRWDINKAFHITLEVGVGIRKSFLGNFEYRF